MTHDDFIKVLLTKDTKRSWYPTVGENDWKQRYQIKYKGYLYKVEFTMNREKIDEGAV